MKRIRKSMAICLLIVIALLTCSCGAITEENIPNHRMGIEYHEEALRSYYILTDLETGVQYLSVPNAGTCVVVDHEGKPYIANGWRDYE